MKRGLQADADTLQAQFGDAESPYLLTDEAARLLRFKEARLFREWAKRQRIPTLHRGRTLLYDRRVLDAFLKLKPSRHGRNLSPLRVVEKVKSVTGNGVAR